MNESRHTRSDGRSSYADASNTRIPHSMYQVTVWAPKVGLCLSLYLHPSVSVSVSMRSSYADATHSRVPHSMYQDTVWAPKVGLCLCL